VRTKFKLTSRAIGILMVGTLCYAQSAAKPAPTDRLSLLVAEWTRAKTGTREYIDAMPESGVGFKPTPEIRSFAQQMLHIAATNYMFASSLSGQENPYDSRTGKDPEKMENLTGSKTELSKFVLGSYAHMIAVIKKLEISDLEQPVQFFNMKMARHLLLAKALEHHAHHRGQTTIYLRLKGITPPSERLF
jgi:uncharacterized damage-inducible protein DinB